MKIETLRNKPWISSIIGVILGALLSIFLPHPLIGIAIGVTLAMFLGNKVLWKEGARRGAIIGLIVILLAGLVILPPEIASSGKRGFGFYDSFLFYLILGVVGSVVIGGGIGAVISWVRGTRLPKKDLEEDFLLNKKRLV